jgi:Cu(I)-responsive transcriptional regulator
MNDAALSIGELARATGVPVETIRYYERLGVIPKPPRTASNYRAYTAAHEGRLKFVKRSRDLGFSLDEVSALLKLADENDQSCCDIDSLARIHLDKVERKIEALATMRDELRDMIDHCGRNTVADCRIIKTLRNG